MAPRKTNNTAPKKPVTRKRVQEKKPLKTPTMLKFKITTPKLDPDSSTPKVTGRQLGVQRKIELANEVALAQLYKNAEIIDSVTTTESEKKKTKPKKNVKTTPPSKPRTRQKIQKTISEFFNEPVEADSAVVTKQTPKKTIKKTPGGRKPKKEISIPQIKLADSTVCKRGRPQKKVKETTTGGSHNLRSKNQTEAGETQTEACEDTRAAVVSSRTNSGASSTPSWTRDISSSSTTTCVTVGDLVRIDHRVPVLQLSDIAASCPLAPVHTPRTPSSSSGSASSSSSSSSSSSPLNSSGATASGAVSTALESPPTPFSQPTADDALNLSISSSDRIEEAATVTSDMAALLNQLVEGQKKLERAFDDWMEHFDEPSGATDDGEIARTFTDLSLEPIVLECRRVRQILRGDNDEETDGDMKVDGSVVPDSKQAVERDSYGSGADQGSDGGHYDEDEISSNDNYMQFDHSPDDEDAISLFAESTFTDCGSSRRDEYVPRPIAQPTARSALPSYARVYNPTPIVAPAPPRDVTAPAPAGPPLLLNDLYQQIHCTQSTVFHGVCFYNVAGSNCRNPKCRYPHVEIGVEELERRIAALGEVDFMQEYMLVRAWPPLRRLYGPKFLREAERRELTRVVLEMAVDFTSKARARSHEDLLQRQAALEAALTRLSCDAGGVRACADLLRMSVPSSTGSRKLQNLLLETLADTANFSRFKRAFIELAALLVEEGARLEPGPVVKILERVCILPYEERLVRAMLALVRMTDAAAVAPLMPQFQALRAALPDENKDDINAPPPPPPAPLADPPAPPQMTAPKMRTVDFLRSRGYPPPRQFRGQWKRPRGQVRAHGHLRPTYQHSTIFRRRTPLHFSNLN